MAKKTTSYNITEVNGKIRKVTTNTRIVQESRLQKSRRIASENSTLFRFALSGTIVMLFFGLFLLIGTTDFYNENQQQLNWIDENGQFIQDSYKISIDANIDIPLDVLNGYTIRQIFENSEIEVIENPINVSTTFYGGGDYSITLGDAYYIVAENQIFNGTVDFAAIQPIPSGEQYLLDDGVGRVLYSSFPSSTIRLFWYILNTLTANLSVKVYNLNQFGLEDVDLTFMNYYHNLYLNNIENRNLDNYYNLGNIPITNLQNMNTVLFKPAIDIVGGMTDTANTAIGFTLQAWNFVGDIWKRIWGVE
jgi:hypothetical protein